MALETPGRSRRVITCRPGLLEAAQKVTQAVSKCRPSEAAIVLGPDLLRRWGTGSGDRVAEFLDVMAVGAEHVR